jgi:hypothetical protein
MLYGFLVLSVIEFGLIAPRRLVEPLSIVAVPPAQLRRRRDVFAPFIKTGALLAEPARPEPIDEYPPTRACEGLVVDTGASQSWV